MDFGKSIFSLYKLPSLDSLFVLSNGNSKGFRNLLHGEVVSICSILKHSRVRWSWVDKEHHIGLLSDPKYIENGQHFGIFCHKNLKLWV